MVRALNTDVALLLSNNGDMTRSTDLDLILAENTFNEPQMLRARYLSFPGWLVAFLAGYFIDNENNFFSVCDKVGIKIVMSKLV